jgi:hypothetical protein
MLPFVLVAVVVSRGRGAFSYENMVVGPVVLLFTGLFLVSNDQEYIRGPLWEFQDLTRTGPLLALVYVLEFGIYAALCPPNGRRGPGGMQALWFYTALTYLLLAPWYRMGDFCDFTTKSSIPSLLVLQVWVARSIFSSQSSGKRGARNLALILLLLVGAVSATNYISSIVQLKPIHLSQLPVEKGRHTNEIEPDGRGGQLFSDGDAFFWQFLARPVEFQRSAAVHGPPTAPPPDLQRGSVSKQIRSVENTPVRPDR